jgi:aspartyl/asparaginyl-tRNA synthetase
MDKTTVRELFRNTGDYRGKSINVSGWIKTIRDSKTFGFIELNDGTFFRNIQVVFDESLDNFKDVTKLTLSEGWIPTFDDVPKQAVSMTVYQIMQCKVIVSCVPYKVKANAIKLTIENELTNKIPATMLKQHSDMYLFIDADSASTVDKEQLKKYE